MKSRTTKLTKAVKKTLLGAALASSLSHLEAGTELFSLPVDENKLESYSMLMEGIRDQSLLPSLAEMTHELPNSAEQIIAMLSDETYQKGVLELDELVTKHIPGDQGQTSLILEKNETLHGYLKRHYPDAVSTLQDYYLNYLRDSGYLDHRSYLKAKGHSLGEDDGLGELMPATYPNAQANVWTVANAYTVVNAVAWANAVAVTMAVAAAAAVAVAAVAVIGGPIFQYESGR